MNERQFTAKKKEDWDRLAAITVKANSRQGIYALSREEVLELGSLYRRASSDLAHARAHSVSPDLVIYLNGLVGQAHALLYEAEVSTNPLRSVVNFYCYEFPAVLQKRYKAFLAALLISVAAGLLAYWMVAKNPANSDLFIPPGFKSSVEAWKSKKISEPAYLEQAGWLMTHNLQVGLTAFALGIALLPDLFLMFSNGAMLGAVSAIMTQVHGHSTFWPGILPHGFAELTAIFICGGAGFILSMALIMPGSYTRLDALKLAGIDALKMVLGTIPMFIFAGMVEGMFSHQNIAPWFRITFAGINGMAWYLYLFLPRRRPNATITKPLPDTDHRNSKSDEIVHSS